MQVFGETFKTDISNVHGLLKSLENSDQNGRFILTEFELKYLCIDVVDIMAEIANECRSIIFCGGTMSPLPETMKQLLPASLICRSTFKSMSHIITPENVSASFISTGPSGLSLNFSYESRNNVRMIQELGMMIINYARVVPAGLVVFFTSFNYMDQVLDIWKSRSIMIGIESIKKVSYHIISFDYL